MIKYLDKLKLNKKIKLNISNNIKDDDVNKLTKNEKFNLISKDDCINL